MSCGVVLSSCNMGFGVIKAEGVVGLSQGFLLAGAASAVVSQYSVFSNFSATVTVSPSGPPGLFKGVTTALWSVDDGSTAAHVG